ncbi:hypothetical protein ABZ915_24480 [Streptomyces sp. NPDC046915]|uniref:hypothetical protein n=1 Tax=Streptomyces sp. NPDC046915 TaxID=3155257 RepID=UPI0033D9A8BA
MRGVRRSASLILPSLCALVSCGIPTTGVVEAGGPAGGAVATTWVYLVADGTLVPVPRQMAAEVGVEPAVRLLLQGPTEKERLKGLHTLLPPLPSTAAPSIAAPSIAAPSIAAPSIATDTPTDAPTDTPTDTPTLVRPEATPASAPVKVTSNGGRVLIELSVPTAKPDGLAAFQLICTAVAAQRVTAPGTEPLPVTVTGPDGRHTEGTGKQCPDG